MADLAQRLREGTQASHTLTAESKAARSQWAGAAAPNPIEVLPAGRLLIRNIAAVFAP